MLTCDLCDGPAEEADYSADGHWIICDKCMKEVPVAVAKWIQGNGGHVVEMNDALRALKAKRKG